jgi:predicted TIM-barrel fold metal-dependent hydrolase
MSAWVGERAIDADGMLAAMDAAGIARTVLVTPSTAYSYDNACVADAAAAHPARFAFVGAIDVRATHVADEIARWSARGMRGFRLFAGGGIPEGDGAWLVDPATFPAWEAAREHRQTISIHCAFGSLPRVRALLERFPAVDVALDHCALPPVDIDAAAPLFALADYPRLHLKVSSRNLAAPAAPPGGPGAFVRRAVATFGAARIAWASNYPSSAGPLATLLGAARAATAELSVADRAAIFSATARRLYRLDD